VLTDHTFAVPLDHDDPSGEQIEVFAREVVTAGDAPPDLPWLLFLQGGPGFGGPRLSGRSSWLDRALSGYRVPRWSSAAPAGPRRSPGTPSRPGAAPAIRPGTCRFSGPTRSSPTPSSSGAG